MAHDYKIFATELFRNLLIAVIGWLTGYLIGYPLTGLILGMIFSLAFLYLNLYRYYIWLKNDKKYRSPKGNGLIADMYRLVSRANNQTNVVAQRQEFILNSLPDAIILLDSRNTIVWLNLLAEKLLNVKPGEAANKPVSGLLKHPDFKEFLTSSNTTQSVEFDSPLNPQIRLNASIIGQFDNSRLLLIRDISELHRLETTRQEFISSASHELRTPLAVISGYLESIEDSVSSELSTPIATMREQANRMEHIIDDLLLLARLDTVPQKIEHLHKPVNMHALLGKIEKEAIAISNENQNITFQCEKNLILNGIEKELHSAFSNLVQNAIKYTPRGGSISVRWHKNNGKAIFEVEDSGPGIEKEHLPLLTQRFYRINISRSRETGGTGLGLSIVNQVLKRHGAQLIIHSTPGKGSRFVCEFPGSRTGLTPSTNMEQPV